MKKLILLILVVLAIVIPGCSEGNDESNPMATLFVSSTPIPGGDSDKIVVISVNGPEGSIFGGQLTISEGETAFSSLLRLCTANNVELAFTGSVENNDATVIGIAGLSEGNWLLFVNGQKIDVNPVSYVVESGMMIEWRYVTES